MYKIVCFDDSFKEKADLISLDCYVEDMKVKGKEGVFREFCTGKRIDYSARAVISPGPEYEVHEIGCPYHFKDILEVKEGDWVLTNRQPSLTRGSILSLQIKFHEGSTIKLHPKLCKIFNADFDGDEMNIFTLRSQDSIDEAVKYMSPYNKDFFKDFSVEVINDTQDYVLEKFLNRKLNVGECNMTFDNFKDICELLVKSGAKGTMVNIQQMFESVGIQMVGGKIAGVCHSSYIEGLSTEEFYIHLCSARQNLINIGIVTPEIGYLQRKMGRGLEGISTCIEDAASRINSAHYICQPLIQKALSSFHHVGHTNHSVEHGIPAIKSLLNLSENKIYIKCVNPHQYIYTLLDDIVDYELEKDSKFFVYFKDDEMFKRRITILEVAIKLKLEFKENYVISNKSLFGSKEYIGGIFGAIEVSKDLLCCDKRILNIIKKYDRDADSSSILETYEVEGRDKAYDLAFTQMCNIVGGDKLTKKHVKNIIDLMFIKEGEVIPYTLTGFRKIMRPLVYSIYESGDAIVADNNWYNDKFTITEELFLGTL